MNQRRLAQNLCAAFVIVLYDRRSNHLRTSNPTAKGYENNQVLVGMRLHRRFYFILCRFQFLLKRVPFVVFSKLVDATPATKQLFTDAQRFCELDDVCSNIFDLLAVLRLHCDKAVGDQTAEVKGDLCPVTVRYRDWSA